MQLLHPPLPFPTVPSGKTIKSPMSHNMVTTFSPDPRDYNLVLFGLPECRSIVDTKESVDEMLQFLAGKSVLVKDLFRLDLLQILKTPVIVPVQF